jgi:hypothetical protein
MNFGENFFEEIEINEPIIDYTQKTHYEELSLLFGISSTIHSWFKREENKIILNFPVK